MPDIVAAWNKVMNLDRSSSTVRIQSEVFLDQPRLVCPAPLIGFERFGAALERNPVEPGLRDRELCPSGNLFQLKHHRSRLGRWMKILSSGSS